MTLLASLPHSPGEMHSEECSHLAGSVRAFFRGNGANVVKIAPETALKLTFNDKMKVFGCLNGPRMILTG